MIDQIFLTIFLGCIIGVITGLSPGLHINLVGVGIISISAILLNFISPIILSTFILSMAITHTFLDSIPSIFLGAPESETALSVLPGHKFLLLGRGHDAVMFTLAGSIFSLIVAIIFSPIIILFIKYLYPYLEKIIVYVLIFSTIFLILKETKNKLWALIIFLISGILGIITLDTHLAREPLFPLFSGLFGISTLVNSMVNKNKIPKQIIKKTKINKLKLKKAIKSSFFAGGLCSFLPGLGPAQAAILGSQMSKNLEQDGFLMLIGGLNTINMVLSIMALYVIDKSRNGAMLVISKLIEGLTFEYLILFFATTMVVGGIATYLTIFFSKFFARNIYKIKYNKVCTSIILLIFTLVLLISGIFGILILVTSTFVGLLTISLGIGRSHMMGCLLLPTIIFFL